MIDCLLRKIEEWSLSSTGTKQVNNRSTDILKKFVDFNVHLKRMLLVIIIG